MSGTLWETKGGDRYGGPKEDSAKIHCVHCYRECGTLAGGFARFKGQPVCSKPTEPDRPDCYRMITVKFHKVCDCLECLAPGLTFYPLPPRTGPVLPG